MASTKPPQPTPRSFYFFPRARAQGSQGRRCRAGGGRSKPSIRGEGRASRLAAGQGPAVEPESEGEKEEGGGEEEEVDEHEGDDREEMAAKLRLQGTFRGSEDVVEEVAEYVL